MPRESEHLTSAEIAAAAADSSGGLHRGHLDVCPECRDEVSTWRDWNEKARLIRARDFSEGNADCPEPAEIARLAAGLDTPGAEELLRHAAECDRCGAILADAGGDVAEDHPMVSSLRTAKPEWQARMAARFVRESGGALPRRKPYWAWAGIAAGIAIAAGAGLWWRAARAAHEPERLLAAAYTAGRPFDYRLPNQGWAPATTAQRGPGSPSVFERPSSLGKAVAEIQRRLESDPGRPDLVLWKGRAELLEGEYDGAADDLERAARLSPSAEVLSDLGTAYALHAERARASDYGRALDSLLQAVRLDSANRNALFNLALVFEHVNMLDHAVATWKRLLSLEGQGPWAEDSLKHLSKVKEKIDKRKAALDGIPADPKSFVSAVSGARDGYDAENAQTAFWSRWLPQSARDPDSAAAAHLLAEDWSRRFHDHLLADALAQAAGGSSSALLAAAGAVIVDNQHGGDVLAGAETSIRDLETHEQHAAAMRVQVELAYSYRRATQNALCLATTEKLLGELNGHVYPWLSGRTRLEHSVCVNRSGGMGPARQERQAVAKDARAQGFQSLDLQARQLVTSIDALVGNSEAVWDAAPKAVAVYWTTAASESRAQQGFYDMALAARGLGWKEAAVVAQQEAVEAIRRWDNPQIEALNRVHLASLLSEAGYSRESLEQLDHADKLYNSLRPGQAVANMILAGKIRRAQTEAFTDPAQAIHDLDALSNFPNLSSLESRMHEQEARGTALAAKGQWSAAEACLYKASGLAGEQVRSFAQPIQRIAAAEMVLDARRNLVQIALTRDNDAAKALRIWEDRWTDLAGARPSGGPALQGGDVAITYVVLPRGVAAFVSSAAGVRSTLLPDPPAVLEAEIHEFHRECASPSSKLDVLRADGRKLYGRLLAPYARELSGARRVLIESDQWISALPFAALVEDNGHYLSEGHAIGAISSLADAAGREDTISPQTQAVIVAAPGGQNAEFSLLKGVDGETSDLARRLIAPELLESPVGPHNIIAGKMASAELLHFAGHGWSNGGNAALVLGVDSAGQSEYLTATDLGGQDWSRCHLAVLSACLTAAGEEHGPVNPQSLVRALLTAGARRVLASRWSVDEVSTSNLMSRFYDALFGGSAPVAALEKASSGVRDTKGWQHPYYWAAFDVFGAP